MKKTSIFISIGLLSALSEASGTCNLYFSQEYLYSSHRSCPYTPRTIYLLFQMIAEYNLPLDPLSQWMPENVQSWEKVYNQNLKMREDYQKLFQRYTLAGLKEQAELIQDALQNAFGPLNNQNGFLGLPVGIYDFEDLPPREVAFIEGILDYIRIWYEEKIQIE
ncbi:MAG: hypothetical protein LBF34_03535 [Puniceicoccales bacterium]|nr:hypothetical protein [Puniceicoccales bacterium]